MRITQYRLWLLSGSDLLTRKSLQTVVWTIVDFPESSRGGESYSQVQPVREHYGKVSAVELVQAVNEIVFAAAVKMDVEKQAVLQRTINLQENLGESQAALLLEQAVSLVGNAEKYLMRHCLHYETAFVADKCENS